MGTTTNQIEHDIETQRENLGSNLAELENKVKSFTDWRAQFRSKPMTMVGIAFGGGVVLASMLSGKSRRRKESYVNDTSPYVGSAQQTNKALETWDNIKSALIGVAATRFKDFIGEVVPGFHEQFRETDRSKSPVTRSANADPSTTDSGTPSTSP